MRDRKDSGLPWVGDIPVDWNVYRGKNVVKKLKRPVKDTDGVITCFRDGEVTLRSNRREEGFTFSEQEVGYQGIEPGDLVIHGMDGFAGSIGISDSRGKGTPVLNVLDSKNDKRFLMYYFRTIAKCGYFESVATGIRVRTCDTNWNKISATPCLVPPLAEQYRIAAYLDERCAKIDEAIARHDALIKKLDEYRKVLVHNVVTHGVPVPGNIREDKESGEIWIGKIPSSWSCEKLKFLTRQHTDRADNNEGYIALENVEGWTGKFVETGNTAEGDTLIVKQGQVLFGKLRPYLAKAYLVVAEGCCSSEFIVLEPIPAEKRLNKRNGITAEYLRYGLSSIGFVNRVDLSTYGTKMPRANAAFINNLLFPVPTPEEQEMIVAHLDKKCAAIDAAKERHAQLMAKLEEYKKSLIYYAVTGKIEC